MQWIDARRKLPTSAHSVLVFNKFSDFVEIASYFEEERRWMCWGDDPKNKNSQGVVTHWMPLPEPPKGHDDA